MFSEVIEYLFNLKVNFRVDYSGMRPAQGNVLLVETNRELNLVEQDEAVELARAFWGPTLTVEFKHGLFP